MQTMTSAEYHELAADDYGKAADAYRLAVGYYHYGDYQQAHEHAKLGNSHSQKAQRYCALAAEWPRAGS